MSDRRVAQFLIGSMVAGFLVLILVAGMTVWLVGRSKDYNALVDHTYQVEGQASEFRVLFERTEAAQRGYLLTGDPQYLNVYARSRAPMERVVEEIGRLTVDNAGQQDRVDFLRKALASKLAAMDRSLFFFSRGERAAALTAFRTANRDDLLARIRDTAAEISAEEARLLGDRSALQTANTQLLLQVVVIAGILLAFLAACSVFIMRRYANALNRSQGALRQLNVGLEQAVEERTHDLTRANQEIQRFAYIVSHDLRSPLVNVMGFTAELEVATEPLKKLLAAAEIEAPHIVTPEARAAVELDLPESVGFIRSSTRKMDRLISAILKLSREGRRTVTPERLEMNGLLEGVIASLHHQAHATGATVEIEGVLPEIVSDRVSVEQIFSNLVENALKYQKKGRPGRVTIRGGLENGRAVFEVEDNGRGVDPKDHDRIFDLFRRAGTQDQPGEGIGLAHVRALTYRLGGVIDCRSELDQGATFRVSLPPVLAREEVQV